MKIEDYPALARATEKLKAYPKTYLYANNNDFSHFKLWAISFAFDFLLDELDLENDADCDFFYAFHKESEVFHEAYLRFPAHTSIDHLCNPHAVAMCREAYEALSK